MRKFWRGPVGDLLANPTASSQYLHAVYAHTGMEETPSIRVPRDVKLLAFAERSALVSYDVHACIKAPVQVHMCIELTTRLISSLIT